MLVTFTFSGGMRNISAGAVIAISYFPSAVVFPVVVGMLFQQIIASIFATILDKHHEESTGKFESKGCITVQKDRWIVKMLNLSFSLFTKRFIRLFGIFCLLT